MNVKWILVAVIVTVVLSRYGRHGREGSTRSWWGSLIMFACFASVFMFLFMGNRGPFRDARFRVPSLPSISFSEISSTPSREVEVQTRLIQARQQYEIADHKHRTPKSARTSSATASSDWTVINEDGKVIAISQTSESRAPRTYRGKLSGIVGFAVGGLIILAFLYIGYLFLDAGTRGQFTWTLRIISIVAFFGICGVVAMLRHRM